MRLPAVRRQAISQLMTTTRTPNGMSGARKLPSCGERPRAVVTARRIAA